MNYAEKKCTRIKMQCGNGKQFQLKYENVSFNANGFYDNAKDESSEFI